MKKIFSIKKIFLLLSIFLSFLSSYQLYSKYIQTPSKFEICADHTPQCMAQPLFNYITAITSALGNDPNIDLLTPAFNSSNPITPDIITELNNLGNWTTGLDGIAMNAYNVSGQPISHWIPNVTSLLPNLPIYITETGKLDSSMDFPSAMDDAFKNYAIKAMLIFNTNGTNPDPNFQYNNGLLGSLCPGNSHCSELGVNDAVFYGVTNIDMHGTKYYLAIADCGAPDNVIKTIQSLPADVEPIIRIGVGNNPSGCADPANYISLLQQVSSTTGRHITAIAGPNEPDLECWIAPACGCNIEDSPGGPPLAFGPQQCNVGELPANRFTSRPAECSSCLDYVPEPVNSCASNFTYTKNLKYTSFNTMTCDNKQCSLNTDACTIELGESSVDGMTSAPQLLVGPIPWKGRFTLNASTVKQPYVGNDTEESREKYIADYVDGTTYYKASIDPGSSPTEDALDPADIFDPSAGQYYSIPPQDPRFVSYAGIVPKLAPQEYLDQIKYSLLDRVGGTTYASIMPIDDYTIGYTWGSTDTQTLSVFADSARRRPLRSSYSTAQEYSQALQNWIAKDNGQWSRLWSYVPLASRQDSPGRFHPIPQKPSAIVPIVEDEGGTVGNPPPLPGDVPPIPPPPTTPGGGNIPTPPPLPVPSPGVDIWVYGQDPQDTRYTGQVTSKTNSSDTHNLIFRTIKYRDRNKTDTTFVRLASRVNMDFSITFPNTPETSILLSPTSEIPTQVTGNTVTFTLPPTPGNYILKTKNLTSLHGGEIMETLSIFIDDYNQSPQAAPSGSIVFDPATDNTYTIQAKINAATPNQTFYFSPGTFNLDNLEIKNKNNLFFILNPNTIISQNDVEGYFIHVVDSGKIVFSGAGIIQAHPDNKQTVLFLEKTQNIAVHDILIYKPHTRDGWTLHIYKSDFTRVQNVRIFSGNDGTDPDSSSNITYTNVYIESQDDAVAVKTRSSGLPTNNLLFQNGFAKSAASALKIGQSSVQSPVDNIVFKDSTVYESDRSLVVDPGEGDGKIGYVLFDNIKVKWVYGGYPNQLTLKVTNSDTYTSGGKEKDGSKNNYGSNTNIIFNNLNADIRQTNLTDKGVTVTNSTFNVFMNNSVFNNCGSLTLQNITFNPPSAKPGCTISSLSSPPLFTAKQTTDPLANTFASSIPLSPNPNTHLLAQTLQTGQVGNHVYQPYPPDPDRADNQTVQKAPAPVQLQLPHLARLYESSNTLYDLLSPYSPPRTINPPSTTPTPNPLSPPTNEFNCQNYPTPSPIPPKDTLKYMTFNVMFSHFDHSGSNNFDTKLQMATLAEILQRESIDIVTLQEMENYSPGDPFYCANTDSADCCSPSSDKAGDTPFSGETINSLDYLITRLTEIGYPMYFSSSDNEYSDPADPRYISEHQYVTTLSRYPITAVDKYSIHTGRSTLVTEIQVGSTKLTVLNLHLKGEGKDGWEKERNSLLNYINSHDPNKIITSGDWNISQDTAEKIANENNSVFFSTEGLITYGGPRDGILLRKNTSTEGMIFSNPKTLTDDLLIEEDGYHGPLIGDLDISRLPKTTSYFSPSNSQSPLFSSLPQSKPNSNIMASSIALSPSSSLQTSNSRLLAQGGATAPQCIGPQGPGCGPSGKGCFSVELQVEAQISGTQLNYCVSANQTCSAITGYIGDCYWEFNGASTPMVKSISPNGTTICSTYNHGGALAPESASPGSSGVISGSIRCNRDVDPNCCPATQFVSCTYTVNPNGSVSTSCTNTAPPAGPPPAPICAPTTLESVPGCSGTIRTGAGDFLCGVQTYDLIIPEPDERFWNLNTNVSQAIDEDGDVTLNADGAYNNLGNACGAAVACEIGGCTCDLSVNKYVETNCRPVFDEFGTEIGQDCDRKCCALSSTGNNCDTPVNEAPNICPDDEAPNCGTKTDNKCVAKPYGSSVNIIGNRDLDTVPLIYPASREVHIATELPYLGIIYKKLIGFPEGSTQFDPNNTPVYRMFTPFRGSSTKPDTVPWYSYHAGDASGWLSVSNKGEPSSSSINGSQDINQPFFFPYLGAIQDGTQFVRDCLTAGYPNGCSSDIVRDFIKGKVCTVQFSKLSFFINQVDEDLLNYLKTAEPPVIKVMGPALNQTDEIKTASAATQIVGRFYTTKWESIPSSYNINDLNSAVQAAQDWISDLKNINPSPNITYWEGINEPVIGPSSDTVSHDRMKWLAKFEATRLNLLKTELNTKGCIGNFSTGNPDNGSTATDFGLWPDFNEAFTAATNTGGVICLHEYATATSTVDNFQMGRYKKMYQYLDTTPNQGLQTVISETGATATGASDSGWRTVFNNDVEKYLTAIKAYDTDISNENRIIGGTLFIYRHPGWPQQEQSPEVLSAIMDGITSNNSDLRCIANQAPPPSGPAVPVDSCFILNETWNLVPPYKSAMTTRLNDLSTSHPAYINRVCAKGPSTLYYRGLNTQGNYWAQWLAPAELSIYQQMFTSGNPDFWQYYTTAHELGHRLHNIDPYLLAEFVQDVLCQPGDAAGTCEQELPFYPTAWPGLWGGYDASRRQREDFADAFGWYAALQKYGKTCNSGSNCNATIHLGYPLHYQFAQKYMD